MFLSLGCCVAMFALRPVLCTGREEETVSIATVVGYCVGVR